MAQSNSIPRLYATIPPAFRLLGCLLLAAWVGGEAVAEKVKWEPAEEVRKTVGAPLVPGGDAEILLVELEAQVCGGIDGTQFPSLRGSIRAPAVIGGAPNRVSDRPMVTVPAPETLWGGRVRAVVFSEQGATAVGRALRGMLGVRLGPILRLTDAQAGRSRREHDEVEACGARLLKTDGRVIELSAKALSMGAEEVPGASFVPLGFPDIGAGDVVEYYWRFRATGAFVGGPLVSQQAIPVRDVKVMVEGFPLLGYSASWKNFPAGTVERSGKTLVCRARALPPLFWEPFGPPFLDVGAALMIEPGKVAENAKQLWLGDSTQWIKRFDELVEPTGAMRTVARELTEGLTSDEARLRRLYEFCQAEFENIDASDSPTAQAAREELLNWGPKPLSSLPEGMPSRIFRQSNAMMDWAWKKRAGDRELINLIFVAMARSIGLTVQPARCMPNTETRNPPAGLGWNRLHRRVLSALSEKGVHFVEPGGAFLPFGMLDTEAEGVQAFKLDKGKVAVVRTPVARAEQSQLARIGRLTLAPDGTVAGTVEVRMSGHVAVECSGRTPNYKDLQDGGWQRSIEAWLGRKMFRRDPKAELGQVVLATAKTAERELVASFQVRIPGYAKVADGRLSLRPAVFANLYTVAFPAAERKTDVCFPYAWQELDEIEIALPAGYELENPSAPAMTGDGGKLLGSSYQLEYRKSDRVLVLKRRFTLGGNGSVVVPVANYAALKRVTDQLNASDAHVIVLRPVAGEGTGGG